MAAKRLRLCIPGNTSSMSLRKTYRDAYSQPASSRLFTGSFLPYMSTCTASGCMLRMLCGETWDWGALSVSGGLLFGEEGSLLSSHLFMTSTGSGANLYREFSA